MRQVFWGIVYKWRWSNLASSKSRWIIRRVAPNDFWTSSMPIWKSVSNILFFVVFGRCSNLNAGFVECRTIFDARLDMSGIRAKIGDTFWDHMFGHLCTKFGADRIKPAWTGTLRKRPKHAFPDAEKIAFKVFWRPTCVCWHKRPICHPDVNVDLRYDA